VIFLTIGTQLPFDRLVKTVDVWAGKHREVRIYAQMGNGDYQPKNIEHGEYISPEEFERKFAEAELIISHAGMGSILTAISYKKPIIIFPRDASLGEHRNNHQLSTAKELKRKGGVAIAFNDEELLDFLDNWRNIEEIHLVENRSKKDLVAAIADFIDSR
jgi:UDP-N-acetylglucosamine transferase subunit ALG13